jgi:hypothetical protein
MLARRTFAAGEPHDARNAIDASHHADHRFSHCDPSPNSSIWFTADPTVDLPLIRVDILNQGRSVVA